jgi:hypothetical protein
MKKYVYCCEDGYMNYTGVKFCTEGDYYMVTMSTYHNNSYYITDDVGSQHQFTYSDDRWFTHVKGHTLVPKIIKKHKMSQK